VQGEIFVSLTFGLDPLGTWPCDKTMAVTDIIEATVKLRRQLRGLQFPSPADFVYSPLDYAWESHEAYLRKYGAIGPKKVLFWV
jgi:hypothetical protein